MDSGQEHLEDSRVQGTEPLPRLSEAELRLLTDEDLILRYQRDDEMSFDELVQRYKDPLMNYIFRFVGDADKSKDILQETFIRLFQKRHLYKTIAKFSTWIYTIAANLAKSELRRPPTQRNVPIRTSDDGEGGYELQITDPDPEPDRVVDGTMKVARIQAALLELPDEFREAVIMRDVQDLTYEDIAEITGTPIGTVKSRINRGRARLQELLKDIYD